MDEAGMIRTYMAAVEAFNLSDMESFGRMAADRCHVMRGNRQIASTRQEFLDGLSEARQTYITSQTVVSASAQGNVVAALFRNSLTDGSTSYGGGLLQFNGEGKVTAVRIL